MKSESCWWLYNIQSKNSIVVMWSVQICIARMGVDGGGGACKGLPGFLWHFLYTSRWAISRFRGPFQIVSNLGPLSNWSGCWWQLQVACRERFLLSFLAIWLSPPLFSILVSRFVSTHLQRYGLKTLRKFSFDCLAIDRTWTPICWLQVLLISKLSD